MRINIFASLPMTGLSFDEIGKALVNAEKAAKELYGDSAFVIDSRVHEKPSSICKNIPAACLGDSIRKMAMADHVLFMPGWQDARGCCIEHDVAKEYGLDYKEL